MKERYIKHALPNFFVQNCRVWPRLFYTVITQLCVLSITDCDNVLIFRYRAFENENNLWDKRLQLDTLWNHLLAKTFLCRVQLQGKFKRKRNELSVNCHHWPSLWKRTGRGRWLVILCAWALVKRRFELITILFSDFILVLFTIFNSELVEIKLNDMIQRSTDAQCITSIIYVPDSAAEMYLQLPNIFNNLILLFFLTRIHYLSRSLWWDPFTNTCKVFLPGFLQRRKRVQKWRKNSLGPSEAVQVRMFRWLCRRTLWEEHHTRQKW